MLVSLRARSPLTDETKMLGLLQTYFTKNLSEDQKLVIFLKTRKASEMVSHTLEILKYSGGKVPYLHRGVASFQIKEIFRVMWANLNPLQMIWNKLKRVNQLVNSTVHLALLSA